MARSRMFSAGFLSSFVLLPALVVACGKTESFGGPPPCFGPQCVDAGGPVSLVPTTTGSVAGVPSATGPASSASTSSSANGPAVRATADIIDQGIEVALRQHAVKVAQRGALPDPQVVRVDLAEGEHIGLVYMLQPNACYTVIAAAVPGVVKELEVKLLLPPFFTMEAGKGKGAPAVIGRSPAPICPISPVALPYKVDVTATKGSGRVGVMLFGKPR